MLQTNTDSLLHGKKQHSSNSWMFGTECYTLKLIPVNVVNKQSENLFVLLSQISGYHCVKNYLDSVKNLLCFLTCFFRCSYVTAITIWWPTTKSFNEMVLNVNRSCWSTGTNAKRVSVVKIRVVSTNVKNVFQTCDEKISV